MAAVSSVSYQEISIHSDRSAGRPLNGDKEMSEATLKNLANFILDNNYEHFYSRESLESLKIRPLSLNEIKFGIRLIQNHPLIQVVSNDENMDESGIPLITMRREIAIRNLSRFGITSENITGIVDLEAGATIKVITVSQNAWNALNRYKEKLEERCCNCNCRKMVLWGICLTLTMPTFVALILNIDDLNIEYR